ncbi:histamine N-methyltransferase-like [Acropora muricata]|uniref:histamine N-methyltransferase-like n=1 Tax=Acropora muricata TaxID=159855 RepID=UPI0034E58646
MAMKLTKLSSSLETYHRAFQLVQTKSNLNEVIRDYCIRATAGFVEQLRFFPRNQVLNVLSIGSGDGKHDIEILKTLARGLTSLDGQSSKPSIQAWIVEPSCLIADFMQSVSSLPEELSNRANVSFQWNKMTFQEFSGASLERNNDTFHFIHFVCSLYYAEAEESLTQCFKKLERGGAILCVIAGEESLFAKLSKRDDVPISNIYTGKEIIAIARRNNWRYEEIPTVNYEMDISGLFDENSPTGNLMLDFLTHTVNFRLTADRALFSEIMDLIRQSSITDEKGKTLLKFETAAVFIYK